MYIYIATIYIHTYIVLQVYLFVYHCLKDFLVQYKCMGVMESSHVYTLNLQFKSLAWLGLTWRLLPAIT